MIDKMIFPGDELVWSSYMLDTALASVQECNGGVSPEPLLEAIWNMMSIKEYNENIKNFCEACGAQLFRFKGCSWHFSWLKFPMNRSQAYFAYYTIHVDSTILERDNFIKKLENIIDNK